VSNQVIFDIAERARRASRALAALSSVKKAEVLNTMAAALRGKKDLLKTGNSKDLEQAHQTGLSSAMIDRLTLSDKVIEGMAHALEEIAAQEDRVGRITGMARRPTGLMVGRMRIPLGVVAIIYESRPNVTSDAAGLCLKSGNAVILRGGSEAFNSNMAIIEVLKSAAADSGINPDVIGFIPVTDRQAILDMLRLEDFIDLVIREGGKVSSGRLRRTRSSRCSSTTRVCAISLWTGRLIWERPTPSVSMPRSRGQGYATPWRRCSWTHRWQAFICPRWPRSTAAWRGTEGLCKMQAFVPEMKPATEEDWYAEFLDLILAVRIVEDLDEAIDHIEKYSSNHTEAIITENYTRAMSSSIRWIPPRYW
jgi:glutamate-5-semialdehyde dehydrogenase